MAVSRRDFLKWTSLAALGAVACNFFPEREFQEQSPARLPEDLVSGTDNWYATLCRQCGETEGIVIRVMEGRAKKVEGNPHYPTNTGAHSARCEAALQALYHPDRIPGPLARDGNRGSGLFRPIDWDEGLNRLADGLRNLSNPRAMLMVTEPLRGHLAFVVGRFAESYGGRHLAFEPVEQTSLRKVMKDQLGQQVMPEFDLANSQYVVSFSADFLSTWIAPVHYARGYGEFRQGKGRSRGTLVQVDPRFSMTAANADQWIPINPGYEGYLALSMAQVIVAEGLADPNRVRAMTGGAGAGALDAFTPEKVAATIGIPRLRGRDPAETIREVAREFARHGPQSLAIGGGSAAAHTNGYFNLSAIYALNFLVGSIGQKGGILFNPPPPVPELATQSKFGSTADWQGIAEELRRGDIKALLVRGVNPVHGLPGGANFRQSLERDDLFVVSFSSFSDETTEMADLVLPERVALEDWGDDVPEAGPGYQVVGMQQPVVNPLPALNPRSFPDVLLTVAHELGGAPDRALPWNTYEELLEEGARKLHGLGRGSVVAPTFDAFWNRLLQQGGWWDKDFRAQVTPPAPPNLADLARQAQRPRIQGPEGNDTFYLVPFQHNSLSEGQGAHLPWLQATPDPVTSATWTTWLEINTQVAEKMGLGEGDVVRVEGLKEPFEVPIYHHPAVPPNTVSIPMGQGHTSSLRYSKDRGVNLFAALEGQTDEKTGALAWAANRVKITPTGRKGKIPKFEGTVPAFPVSEEERVVKVTRG